MLPCATSWKRGLFFIKNEYVCISRFRKHTALSKNLHTATDEELVEYYRNSHDTVYIGELYLRYTHLVYGVCLKYLNDSHDAKDATMQIFEQLIRELKKHRITAFKSWLYTVVKNFCLMEFRKENAQKQKSKKMTKELLGNVETDEQAHLEEVEDKEALLLAMERGLSELNEQQQKCLQLFYKENLSYKEIQQQTGFELNEVKSHIQNGKRNLKQYMTDKHG